jgi:hypothetical protein
MVPQTGHWNWIQSASRFGGSRAVIAQRAADVDISAPDAEPRINFLPTPAAYGGFPGDETRRLYNGFN